MAEDLRVILVPRFGGTLDSDWYRWLRERLAARSKFPLGSFEFCPLQPVPEKPAAGASVRHLGDLLGSDASALARTVVVGHSLGAQVALRALVGLNGKAKLAGVVCVAGWLKLDLTPKTLKGWLQEPIDLKAARAGTAKLINIVSRNDPNQIDAIGVTRQWKESELAAEVVIGSEPGHFSGHEEPLVLDTILDRFG